MGEIVAGTAVEPHLRASFAGNDAEAIVFDLVQPIDAGRQLVGLVGRHGAMKPVGRVRIRNIMPIVRDYSRASQSFLFARITVSEA